MSNPVFGLRTFFFPSVVFVMARQVVGCVVRSCDTSAYPPKLSLALDVAGKTEQMGDATALEV